MLLRETRLKIYWNDLITIRMQQSNFFNQIKVSFFFGGEKLIQPSIY